MNELRRAASIVKSAINVIVYGAWILLVHAVGIFGILVILATVPIWLFPVLIFQFVKKEYPDLVNGKKWFWEE